MLPRDSGAVRPAPALARLERRQQAVLDQLAGLGLMLDEVRQRRGLPPLSSPSSAAAPAQQERLRLAVYAAPDRPPLSVGLLCRLLAAHAPVWCRAHLHSTCPAGPTSPAATRLLPVLNGGSPADAALHLTLIWRPGKQVETVVSPLAAPALTGEAVTARLLARMLQPWRPNLYAENPAIDVWLDQADDLAAGGDRKTRAALVSAVTAALAGRRWLVGGEATLADVVVWSVLTQLEATTPPLKKWAEAVEALA